VNPFFAMGSIPRTDGWLLISGIVIAIGSGAFAYLKIRDADSNFAAVGSSHLGLFAQPRSFPDGARSVQRPSQGLAVEIDMTTISSIGETARSIPLSQPALVSGDFPPNSEIPGFSVLWATTGAALVMTPGGLIEASRGTSLADGGIVLDITATERGWLVKTSAGVVKQRR
jgi:hypothetical protein